MPAGKVLIFLRLFKLHLNLTKFNYLTNLSLQACRTVQCFSIKKRKNFFLIQGTGSFDAKRTKVHP